MLKRILLILGATILGLVSNAQALPIIQGSVHVDDPTATTGTAIYTFYNVPSVDTNFTFNHLDLYFAGNVFNLVATPIDPVVLTAGWSDITVGGGVLQLARLDGLPGTGIPEAGSLTFTVEYTLQGPAENLPWLGSTWGQLFTGSGDGEFVLGNINLPLPMATGGITSPAPEPTSILLLGAGLAGLGFFGRRRFRGRSQHS